MQVPLNILHDYIGVVVMTGLSIDILRRNRRKPNLTTLYFGLATGCFALATGLFGLPALFTRDAFWLSLFTFIGDIFVSSAMLLLWFIGIRAFLATRPRATNIAYIAVIILTILCMAEAIHRNLTPPYSTMVTVGATGKIAVEYVDTLLYNILNPIDSLALVLIGIYFFRQANVPPQKSQRIRLRGVSIGFVFGALAFLVTPALSTENQVIFTAVTLNSGFLVIAVAGIISLILVPRERKAQLQG